jgi:dihydropteroate synthase
MRAKPRRYNQSMRPSYRWQLRARCLELGPRTLVMGVLNVTPDSFSDGGKFLDSDRAVQHALLMLQQGADIIDIGGESTRPGALIASRGSDPAADAADSAGAVSAEEELRRMLPVLQQLLRQRPDALVSVDTYKSVVARAAVGAGAQIVNDVSGLTWDPEMSRVCSELQCGVVLMHTRGRPNQWASLPPEQNLVSSVRHELANRVQIALENGVSRDRIAVDPGFGFGKNPQENYALLARLDRFHSLGFPLLAGTSRKRFVAGPASNRLGGGLPPADRLYGSLAAMVASILMGAHIVRVHDVQPAIEAAAVADAILSAQPEREPLPAV